MRYTISALTISVLLFAPVIAGCEGEKKKGPEAEYKESPDKKKSSRGLTAPPVPEAPP